MNILDLAYELSPDQVYFCLTFNYPPGVGRVRIMHQLLATQKWQDNQSYSQGRQQSGYSNNRPYGPVQGYQRDRTSQSRRGYQTRYQVNAGSGTGRNYGGSAARGSQMDGSNHMVSLNRAARAYK